VNASDIQRAFVVLSANYGARFQTPGNTDELRVMVNVWADMLSDIPSDAGLAAFRRYCEMNTQPPTPAHIRELAQPRSLPAPAEAWEEALCKAAHEGFCGGNVPHMSHPEIAAAARAANWHAICFAENDRDLSFTRQAFLRCYQDFCTRTEREENRTAIEGACRPELLPKMKTVQGAIEGH
jgi:hypothetical protein